MRRYAYTRCMRLRRSSVPVPEVNPPGRPRRLTEVTHGWYEGALPGGGMRLRPSTAGMAACVAESGLLPRRRQREVLPEELAQGLVLLVELVFLAVDVVEAE